jgi:hypothetical protein
MRPGTTGANKPAATSPFAERATGNRTKVHPTIEIPRLLDLNTEFTAGRVHDSQRFAEVWANLPDTIDPIRNLADNAHTGNDCLTTARDHGTTPFHDLRKDHRYERFPETAYGKLLPFRHALAQPLRTAQTASQPDRNHRPGNENQVRRPAQVSGPDRSRT